MERLGVRWWNHPLTSADARAKLQSTGMAAVLDDVVGGMQKYGWGWSPGPCGPGGALGDVGRGRQKEFWRDAFAVTHVFVAYKKLTRARG